LLLGSFMPVQQIEEQFQNALTNSLHPCYKLTPPMLQTGTYVLTTFNQSLPAYKFNAGSL